jgi:dynein light chain Tctex-type 1
MSDDDGEEWIVNKEEVGDIVNQAIEKHLKDREYDPNQEAQWVDWICESTMQGLAELKKPYKYAVTCLIMQKNGAGVHVANSYCWDSVCDIEFSVTYPDAKSASKTSLYAIVSVGCFAMGTAE